MSGKQPSKKGLHRGVKHVEVLATTTTPPTTTQASAQDDAFKSLVVKQTAAVQDQIQKEKEAKAKAEAEAKAKAKAENEKSLNEAPVTVQNAPKKPEEQETKEKAEKLEEKKVVNDTSTSDDIEEEVTYKDLGGGFKKDQNGRYFSRQYLTKDNRSKDELLSVVTVKGLLRGYISKSFSGIPSVPKPILAGAGAVLAVGALGMIAFGIAFATGDVSSFQFFAKLSMDIVIGAAAATAVVGLATAAGVAEAAKKPVQPEGFEMVKIDDVTVETVDAPKKSMSSRLVCFFWDLGSKKANNVDSNVIIENNNTTTTNNNNNNNNNNNRL